MTDYRIRRAAVFAIHEPRCQDGKTQFTPAQGDKKLHIFEDQAGLCFLCGHDLPEAQATLVRVVHP